jgi:hypothetical protein
LNFALAREYQNIAGNGMWELSGDDVVESVTDNGIPLFQ